MDLNYSLIGSFPVSDKTADSLPELIKEYESTRSNPNANKAEQIARGVLIEMLAGHVYGIDAQKYDRISDVIDAIRSMDAYVEFS